MKEKIVKEKIKEKIKKEEMKNEEMKKEVIKVRFCDLAEKERATAFLSWYKKIEEDLIRRDRGYGFISIDGISINGKQRFYCFLGRAWLAGIKVAEIEFKKAKDFDFNFPYRLISTEKTTNDVIYFVFKKEVDKRIQNNLEETKGITEKMFNDIKKDEVINYEFRQCSFLDADLCHLYINRFLFSKNKCIFYSDFRKAIDFLRVVKPDFDRLYCYIAKSKEIEGIVLLTVEDLQREKINFFVLLFPCLFF